MAGWIKYKKYHRVKEKVIYRESADVSDEDCNWKQGVLKKNLGRL